MFNQWLVEYNDVAETKCPPDILLTKDPDVLAHWLCVFISEIRKTDGGEYTPRSLSHFRRLTTSVYLETTGVYMETTGVYMETTGVYLKYTYHLHFQWLTSSIIIYNYNEALL